MARATAPASSWLLALLAMAITGTAVGWRPGAGSVSVCDTAKCGKGSCSEVPGPIPFATTSYNCTCDPGWSKPRLSKDVPPLSFAPCTVPICTLGGSTCSNLNVTAPIRGIPLTDPCARVSCGPGGECRSGGGFSYQCQCRPGFRNMLHDTSMPCVGGDCAFGPDCAKLGLTNPPGSPAPAPAESGLLY